MNIGIDVGGVLASLQHEGQYPSDANRVIIELQSLGHRLFIVSQCGKQRQQETRKYLKDNGTPINQDSQYYIDFKVKTKAGLIDKLNLDVLIDDRPKHGFAAINLGCYWLHFTEFPLLEKWRQDIDDGLYCHVRNWQEVRQAIDKL